MTCRQLQVPFWHPHGAATCWAIARSHGRSFACRSGLRWCHLQEETRMAALTHRRRVTLIVLLILDGLLLSMYGAGRLAEQQAWIERSQEAGGQLELYAQAIHTQVERFRSVPALL